MSNDESNPELEERWQRYLQRKRNSKYLMATGGAVIIVSLILGLFPVAIGAPTPWSAFFIVGLPFGIFLIILGICARIPPHMGEEDALWVMKMGPFGKQR